MSRLDRKNAFVSRNSAGEGQIQSDLPAAGKFDIYLRQQLRIEQRAVFDAVGTVDAVTSAQRIERMLCSRVPRTGNGQSIDSPFIAQLRGPAQRQHATQKPNVELGLMRKPTKKEKRIGEEEW